MLIPTNSTVPPQAPPTTQSISHGERLFHTLPHLSSSWLASVLSMQIAAFSTLLVMINPFITSTLHPSQVSEQGFEHDNCVRFDWPETMITISQFDELNRIRLVFRF
jgi:hypothetical protein